MRHSFSFLTLAIVMVFSPSLQAASRRVEMAAPDFSLPTSAGGSVSLHDFRGKVVLVDFWASWCMPCRQSFPWMADMLEKYAAEGLQIVAVNLDKKDEAASAFLDRYPASFPVVFDPAGRTAEAFHVQAMPSSFLVNRVGKIVYAHEGFEPSKAGAMEERIKEELAR